MTSRAIPALRYDDAPRMIEWLCACFGFERQLLIDGPDATIAHAQLTLGHGMVMLSSNLEDEFGRLQRHPRALGGTTQSTYLVVEDPDALHARAVAQGATVVIPPRDEEYGGRGFTVRDPEGHLWSVGSYDPWKG